MKQRGLLGALGFLLGLLSLSLNLGPQIHIPVGGGRGPLLMSGLGPSEAVWSLPDAEVGDGRRDFYFRQILSGDSALSIPLRPRSPFSVAVRMDTTIRTRIDLLHDAVPKGGNFVPPGPWAVTDLATKLEPGPLRFGLHFEDAPLVGRSDTHNFRRYIDEVVLRADAGFDLPWPARIAGGLVAFLLAWFATSAVSRGAGLATALLGPVLLAWLSIREPVALGLALPRLLGCVAVGALLISFLCAILRVFGKPRAALVLLGSAMILAYGFFSFLPRHSPADLDIHIWRTVDLAEVPMTYDAWLRFGSHYPTPSQVRGSATEALGAGPLIPYSPLPYVLFYVAHAAGLDLHWSMNAIEAMCLALLLPFVYAFARAASSEAGGLLAASFMALDLATVHHLGRAHSPAVVGGVLGLACLLAFGLSLSRMEEAARWKVPALLLGLGALGYSSTPLFYALFGTALLALIAASPSTRSLFRPIALALAAGGGLAIVLYYGHYVPGLLQGGGTALAGDPFPGRTFFIFHNESRQSLRLWSLGLFIPFLAAIPALAIIVTRTSPAIRSFISAWLLAWAGIMLLKEPWALPIMLRWAKEDFYVAPALTLVVAIAIARLRSRPLRFSLATLSVVAAFLLRARDYGFHADTLRFLR